MTTTTKLQLLMVLLPLLCGSTTFALPVFQDYGPPSDVSQLDLDARSIVAKSGLASENGMSQARNVYQTTKTASSIPSLQSLSTGSDIYRDFELYKQFTAFYGGEASYADQWVNGAFTNNNVKFGTSSSARQANFRLLDYEGRSVAARWGPVVLNVYMGVASHLAHASSKCENNSGDMAGIRQNWDTAFALYTGSLAESEHPLGGYLLYNLAQRTCLEFGTCARGDEAPVNTRIIQAFVEGKNNLENASNCESSKGLISDLVQTIQKLLAVPMIQATLRAAYSMDVQDDSGMMTQGEAAAFSAATAPILHGCSSPSADIIYNDLRPGRGPQGSFEVVKAAMERHYQCLGITCSDVGGLTSSFTGDYYDRAEACDNVRPVDGVTGIVIGGGGGGSSSPPPPTYEPTPPPSPSSPTNGGGGSWSPPSSPTNANHHGPGDPMSEQEDVIIGISVGAVLSVVLMAITYNMCLAKKNQKEFDTQVEDVPEENLEENNPEEKEIEIV